MTAHYARERLVVPDCRELAISGRSAGGYVGSRAGAVRQAPHFATARW
jgi:hypothetical protein